MAVERNRGTIAGAVLGGLLSIPEFFEKGSAEL